MLHIGHKVAAQSCAKCREHLLRTFVLCIVHQEDFVGVDANASSYKYFNGQGMSNHGRSSVVSVMEMIKGIYSAMLKKQPWKNYGSADLSVQRQSSLDVAYIRCQGNGRFEEDSQGPLRRSDDDVVMGMLLS